MARAYALTLRSGLSRGSSAEIRSTVSEALLRAVPPGASWTDARIRRKGRILDFRTFLPQVERTPMSDVVREITAQKRGQKPTGEDRYERPHCTKTLPLPLTQHFADIGSGRRVSRSDGES